MADQHEGRTRRAGDRNRAQRLKALRLQARQDRWEIPDEPRRRSHRATRTRRSR